MLVTQLPELGQSNRRQIAALVAAMRKLRTILNAIVAKREIWNPNLS